jgi:hypothetical protein
MNRQSWKIRFTGLFVAMTAVSTLAIVPAFSQVPVDDQGNPLGSAEETAVTGFSDTEQAVALSAGDLDELVGPVALYPDDLLAIVLPASTYPLEIVQAARFLEQYEQDSTLKPNEDWDESVTALLNYPEVLRMMNDDIDWTWKLGDAVVNQQADVIAAVETFRDRAYAAGNLKSDQHQSVSEDDGIIEIVPVNDEIIYVPYYEPEQVVVRQVTPVYYYYPRPYPVYYYPYPVGYSFYSGYFWGVTTAYRIGWATDHLHTYHHSYWGHPYFGHSYYGHFYRQPSVYVYNSWYVNNSPYYSSNRYRDGDYWRPRTHSRARPAYYSSRTRSYRDNDVNRASSSRGYGNAYTTKAVSRESGRESTQLSTNRSGRLPSSGERVRTEQGLERGSTREVSSDNIRFRERSENRQTVRQDPAAGATRSGTTTRTESRTTTRADSRRSPVTTTTTASTINNRNRELARETIVRRPASERSDSAVARQSNSSSDARANSRATRQTGNAAQPALRNSNRESARVEVRNSTPERREVRTNSRPETRPESKQESRSESRSDARQESRSESRDDSRQAQASVRHGSQARRERN